MKKKIYLICYAVLQSIISIYTLINVNVLAKDQVKLLTGIFKSMPKETQDMAKQLFTLDYVKSSLTLTAILGLVLGIILLWLFVRDRVSIRKGLTITLIVISLLLGLSDIISIAAIIALFLVFKVNKVEKTKKEQKEVGKLREFKITGKDLLWVVILVLAYSTQFIAPVFINNKTVAIVFEIVFYVLIFSLVLYIFGKRLRRDFASFKEKFSSYIVYIFKWWGIMLGLSVVAAMVRIVLGGAVETANQAGLSSMPLWYVAPLAIVWAPFVEEGIFRGGLRRFVKNDKLFIVLSAIIFGLVHTIGSEVGLYNMFIQSLQYMVMGGVMAYVYTKTNNIFVNMGVHCVQNTFSIIMMFLMSFM